MLIPPFTASELATLCGICPICRNRYTSITHVTACNYQPLNAAGQPVRCSECGHELKPGGSVGRPRASCDDLCARRRHNRLRAKERAVAKKIQRAAGVVAELNATLDAVLASGDDR